MSSKTVRTVAKWAARVALCGLLLLVAFAILVLVVLPRATHGAALTVLTGSMTPTIPVGSVVIDRPVDPGTLRVGDIATYQVAPGKPEYVTHRIIAIDATQSPTLFRFKGDANRGADIRPVPATAIRGKVWFHVPYLGGIRDTLHPKQGLAGIAILLLAAYAIVMAGAFLRDRRKQAGDRPTVPVSSHDDQRTMIAARVPLATLGMDPDSVARLLGGVLLARDDETATVLLVERPKRFDEAIGLLSSLQPTELLATPLSAGRVTGILSAPDLRWAPVPHSAPREVAIHA